MGSEIGIIGNIDTVMDDVMEVSPSVVEDGKSRKLPEEMLGNCESNREGDTYQMEALLGGCGNGVGVRENGKDLEVDVVGDVIADESEDRAVERESQDATECSSSFGCTDSESGTGEALGDVEVESQVRNGNIPFPGFDGCSDIYRGRKKKLTPHWRSYVQPLMWRCKWVELQIRELQSQASKYARELAEFDERKQCELEKVTTEDHAVKLAPFVCQNRSVKVMKRKKRKRVEETVDLTSYTASHSLFSYFASKRSSADICYMDDLFCRNGKTPFGNGELGVDVELPSLEFKDCDAFEGILRKIEEAQIHVRQLRMRMDKVVIENAEKMASDHSRSANQSTCCGPNYVLPHVHDGPALLGSATTYPRLSNKSVMPETAVSTARERTPGAMIETIGDQHIRGNSVKIAKQIQNCNRTVKQEFGNSKEDARVQLLPGSPSEPEGKPKLAQNVRDPSLCFKMKMPQEQPTVKIRSSSKTPLKNKRKRGRRKARTGRWTKKSSG